MCEVNMNSNRNGIGKFSDYDKVKKKFCEHFIYFRWNVVKQLELGKFLKRQKYSYVKTKLNLKWR